MFILSTYSSAVVFCVITMLCWGSWANSQKLADKNWRFELFYLDYSVGVLLLALFFALTLGSIGSAGRPFAADLVQADIWNVASALVGGFIFNAANILLVAAIGIAGMSVAFPVGIGIALVLGVIVNYLGAPAGNPKILFVGVALVVAAILLDAKAYQGLSGQNKQTPVKGIVMSVICGVLMGFFYRFVAAAMTTNFSNPEPGKLGPYTAVFVFCLGVLASSAVYIPILLKKPFIGAPLKITDYFRGGVRDHMTGIFGGVIWCVGMSFSILASERAGFAISYGLGQGATMIAAIWGIFVWKEFKQGPAGTGRLLAAMMAAYVLGLSCIIMARVYA